MPPLGATRVYFSDDEWQAGVANLSKNCVRVILRPGPSNAIVWEVEHLLNSIPPRKFVLWLGGRESHDAVEYETFRTNTAHLWPRPLPKKWQSNGFLLFEEDWRPFWIPEPAGVYSRSDADPEDKGILQPSRTQISFLVGKNEKMEPNQMRRRVFVKHAWIAVSGFVLAIAATIMAFRLHSLTNPEGQEWVMLAAAPLTAFILGIVSLFRAISARSEIRLEGVARATPRSKR